MGCEPQHEFFDAFAADMLLASPTLKAEMALQTAAAGSVRVCEGKSVALFNGTKFVLSPKPEVLDPQPRMADTVSCVGRRRRSFAFGVVQLPVVVMPDDAVDRNPSGNRSDAGDERDEYQRERQHDHDSPDERIGIAGMRER